MRKLRTRERLPKIEIVTSTRGSRVRNLHVFHGATCVVGEQFTHISHKGGDAVFANALVDEIRAETDG